MLLQLFVATSAATGPLVLDIDETSERRHSQEIAATGTYRDPVRCSHSHFVKVNDLRWVCLMLLVPIPAWTVARRAARVPRSRPSPSPHPAARHASCPFVRSGDGVPELDDGCSVGIAPHRTALHGRVRVPVSSWYLAGRTQVDIQEQSGPPHLPQRVHWQRVRTTRYTAHVEVVRGAHAGRAPLQDVVWQLRTLPVRKRESGSRMVVASWPRYSWVPACAEAYLAPLGDRWRHVRGVVRLAQHISALFADAGDRDLLIAAAYLHDIGYAPTLASTAFHPLDGARYVRARAGDERLAGLVAHHSGARFEAELRGYSTELAQFARERSAVDDALTFCDLLVGPTGQVLSLQARHADIVARHGEAAVVCRAYRQALPSLALAVGRTMQRLHGKGISVWPPAPGAADSPRSAGEWTDASAGRQVGAP